MSSASDRESIWTRSQPGSRRPAHTRESITRAGIAIADAEGLKAVSMRRLATELDAGTMTLYHYIRTKDELLTLMDDAIMGELLVPGDELPADWREALAEIARRTRATSMRHPWMSELPNDGETGPNALRHVEQSLEAVSRTGLDEDAKLELMLLVDDYVFGFVCRAVQVQGGAPDPEIEAKLDSVARYLDAQLDDGAYPHLKAFAGDDARAAFGRMARMASDDERFERGLQTLLDGIAIGVERRSL
jgi:AcrR family transcriptional regulator